MPHSLAPPSRYVGVRTVETRMDDFEARLGLSSLPVVPPSGSATRGRTDLRSGAVQERLQALGYTLTRAYSGTLLSRPLPEVVKEFQRDAGLVEDGWVGEETWTALQEFVTLEPPLKLEQYVGPQPLPAMVRALGLRLQLLGFEVRRPSPDFSGLQAPLARFEAVAQRLALLPPGPLREWETVQSVFDDSLLHRLAERALAGEGLLTFPLRLSDPESTSDEARFVRRLVRTELWLLGYDVGSLEGSTDGPQARARLEAAIGTFWGDVAESSGLTPPPDALAITPELLNALRVEGKATGEPAPAQSRLGPGGVPEALNRFVEANPAEMKQIWARAIARAPTFFVWDGLERCERWLARQLSSFVDGVVSFGKLLARGLERAKTFLWNVVRFLYQRASGILSTVRKAVAVLTDGLQTLLAGEIRLNPKGALVASQVRLDGSSVLLISPEARPEDLEGLRHHLERYSRFLSVGGAIVLEMVDALALLASGPAGWISCVAHLMRVAPGWERQLEGLGELPEAPPNQAPLEGWRVALAVAVAALLAGVGVLAWKAAGVNPLSLALETLLRALHLAR